MDHDAQVSEPPSPPRTLLEEILVGNPLTKQELLVLEDLASGLSARQSGSRRFLATETVKTYRKRIFAKLAARNAPHAVRIAMRLGMIA